MGYETELFVQQPVDPNLVCVICHSVQQKPMVVCKNGHTFCATCIATWQKESNECPDCRSPITNKVICLPVQNLIKALRVRCPVKVEKQVKEPAMGTQTRAQKRARVENGHAIAPPKTTTVCCDWEGTLEDYLKKHKKRECGLRKVKCPFRCGEEVLACDLEEHKETDCKNRRVTCALCKKQVLERLLDRHKEEWCQESMTSCQYCGETMLRKLLGTKPGSVSQDDLPQDQTSKTARYTMHYKICPKMLVTCEFHSHGCNEKIAREDLDKHHVEFARKHATLVTDKIEEMESDKVWSEENMSWEIPTAVLMKAHQTRTGQSFVVESRRVPVGDYQAFLRLTIRDGNVTVGVGVDRPTFEPYIDRLKIWCDDALLEMKSCTNLEDDGGGTWTVEDDFTCPTDDGAVVDVTLDNLLDWAAEDDDKCIIYAEFRLCGPEDTECRRVGCQPSRVNHSRSPSY